MKNKLYIYLFFFILLFTIFWFYFFSNSDEITSIDEKINKFSEEEKIIVNEKLDIYNKQISDYLINYTSTGIFLTVQNNFKEFEYLKPEKWAKNKSTIYDFNIDYNMESKNLKESEVSLFFANNKMAYLFDSIFLNKKDDIYKYLFINYIELYSKNKKIKLTPKITYNTDYQNLTSVDSEIYKFNVLDEIEYIHKYFLLSSLEKSWIKIDIEFKKLIYNDIVSNYKWLKNNDKLLFLVYLNNLWELDNFLTSVDENLSELPWLFWFESSELAYFVYLLSLKDKSNPDLDWYISTLEAWYDKLDIIWKIMLIWALSNLEKDYSLHYSELEKVSNYDLTLKEQFIKFFVFKEFKNEYTIYDNYSKFWWSSWLQVNKNKEFVLSNRKLFYYTSFTLDKVIYDNLIDTRVVSFFWDKFYLNITLKQK